MDYKDYYRSLGVAPTASADEIKKAYRKLARRYHPDLSQEKDAAARMAEINEAHAVLSDPEKRAAYDQLGQASQPGQGFTPPPDWDAQDFHFRSTGDEADFSDFFEQLFGRAAQARHARQGGAGGSSGRGGQARPHRGQDLHASITLELADSYQGTVHHLQLRGSRLDAQGHLVPEERELQVSIPRGVKEGQMVRLAGQGHPGLAGAPAGDLLLEVRFAPDARWHAQGRDVYQPLALAPWEAALGGPLQVQTLAGTLEVAIPPGYKRGKKLRIKGKGLPAATPGDLYLVLEIALPHADTDAARAAYEALARACPDFQPRPGHPGGNA